MNSENLKIKIKDKIISIKKRMHLYLKIFTKIIIIMNIAKLINIISLKVI
jgi:hypothetical protein